MIPFETRVVYEVSDPDALYVEVIDVASGEAVALLPAPSVDVVRVEPIPIDATCSVRMQSVDYLGVATELDYALCVNPPLPVPEPSLALMLGLGLALLAWRLRP